MLKNYLKTAYRNLIKNKKFSAINICGLAAGLASCLLIILYVLNEFSYDKHNVNVRQIYRIDSDLKFGGHHFVLASTPDPLGPALKNEFPQVKQFVRFRSHGGIFIKKNNQNIRESGAILTDSTLFDVFTLPMLAGDPQTALTQPRSIVLTNSMAEKYFPDQQPVEVLGKSLTINDTSLYKITGVIKDIPETSHFHFDFFIPMYGLLRPYEINQWTSNNFKTYILLEKSAEPKVLSAQLDDLVMKNVLPFLKGWSPDPEEFSRQGNYLHYELMPLHRIHLHSQKEGELEANGNIQFVAIFSVIAIFILLIACVNFMNLSTARSSLRAREVGVRKVLGSTRQQLIFQFLSESFLISFLSMVLALIIAILLLPYFNTLSGKNLVVADLLSPLILISLILLTVIVGILAGMYPAFYLSSFMPVGVLKGGMAGSFKTGWLRSGLVVFQFAISIFLIIGTIVIYSQLNYIQTKDVGYSRDQILILKNTSGLGRNVRSFKEEVLKLPGVENATITGYLPTSGWRSDNPIFPELSDDINKTISAQIWRIDENYIPTLDMKFVKGRNFSTNFPTDSSGVIINEAFAKLMAKEEVLNQPLYFMEDFPGKELTKYQILGVVKNFNFNSLRENITPLVFLWSPQHSSIALRIKTANIDQLIGSLERIYKKTAPGHPFEYSFMDEDFNNTYKAEQKLGGLSITFAVLAILIACLGLFGLITFAAGQRSKEIGIRKVLGASIADVSSMLAKDYLKLVAVAGFISFPLAWWAMNHWLQGFAYRISISWWIFVVAGLLAALIALITLSYQALKAAVANPADALRTE